MSTSRRHHDVFTAVMCGPDTRSYQGCNDVDRSDAENNWDAASRAVLARCSEAQSTRLSMETLNERDNVMERIRNICQSFELGQSLLQYKASCGNMEYIKDMPIEDATLRLVSEPNVAHDTLDRIFTQLYFQFAELEEVLKDHLKKRRYQDQVTVFIVGYEHACFERLKLLQQVSEFFSLSSVSPPYDQQLDDNDDVNGDAMTSAFTSALNRTKDMLRRLNQLHIDVVERVRQTYQSKAVVREKKKLEKNLQKAHEEITSLNGTVLRMQQEIVEKEEKVRELLTIQQSQQKNSAKQPPSTTESIGTGISSLINGANHVSLAIDADIFITSEPDNDEQFYHSDNDISPSPSTPIDYENNLNAQSITLSGVHETGTTGLTRDMKAANTNKQAAGGGGVGGARIVVSKATTDKQSISSNVKTITRQQSQQSAVAAVLSGTTIAANRGGAVSTSQLQQQSAAGVSPTRGEAMATDNRLEPATAIGTDVAAAADSSTDAHGYVSSATASRRIGMSPSQNDDVMINFDNSIELNDEESWSSIPTSDIVARFKQYRALSLQKIKQLTEQVDTAEERLCNKTNSLKAQFNDQKARWQAERSLLMESVSQTQKLQTEADNLLVQMEQIIRDHEIFDVNPADVVMGSAQLVLEHPSSGGRSTDTEVARTNQQQTDEAAVAEEQRTGRAMLYAKHRALLATLKSRAEQTRSSSVGLQLLASRDQSFRVSELADQQNDLLSSTDTTASSAPAATAAAVGSGVAGNDKDEDISLASTASIMPDSSKDTTSIKSQTLHGRDQEVFEAFIKIYNSLVELHRSLQPYNVNKDTRWMYDVENVYQKDVHLKLQLDRVSEVAFSILNEIRVTLSSFNQRSKEEASGDKEVDTDNGQHSEQNHGASSDSMHLSTMINRYQSLEKAYATETARYQDLLDHKSVEISQMQETIDKLKYELMSLQEKAVNLLHYQKDGAANSSPVMFTRLDGERNAMNMKKALSDKTISVQQYQTAVKTMEQYNSLPAQRLAHLTRKYVCYRNTIDIQEKASRTKDNVDVVWDTVSKLVSFNSERMKRYTAVLQALGLNRYQLAEQLMETLTDIEQESGIFLIKPMFSFRSRKTYPDSIYQTKKTRPNQPAFRKQAVASTPVPTAATAVRNVHATTNHSQVLARTDEDRTTSGDQTQMDQSPILEVSKQPLIGEPPQPMWTAPQDSERDIYPLFDKIGERLIKPSQSTVSPTVAWTNKQRASEQNIDYVPRMLELDINRVVINQNNISVRTSSDSIHQQVTSAPSTRSYVAISRVGKQHPMQRSQSATGLIQNSAVVTMPQSSLTETAVPTSSMTSLSTGTGSSQQSMLTASPRTGRNLMSTQPLPPINMPSASGSAPAAKSQTQEPNRTVEIPVARMLNSRSSDQDDY